MKLETVLIIAVVAFVNASDYSSNNVTSTKLNQEIVSSSSSEETKQSINFPKNVQKFVVTMKSIKASRNMTNIEKLSRKPLMKKIVPKIINMNHKIYWKTSTRQPFMKYTKFTTNPLTASKNYGSTKNHNNKVYENKRMKTNLFNKIKVSSKKDDSSEEILENSAGKMQENNKIINKITSPLHKIRPENLNKTSNDTLTLDSKQKYNNSQKNVPIGKTNLKESDYSSEEREDTKEFIFIKDKKTKENHEEIPKDSGESEETTTTVAEEANKRDIRSINIIEEENLGTTVSGFKFTGKIASLSSNLIFRNINTK